MTLHTLAVHAATALWEPAALRAAVVAAGSTFAADDKPALAQTGLRIAGCALASGGEATLASHGDALADTLAQGLGERPSEVRRTAAASVAAVAKAQPAVGERYADRWTPGLLACVREKNIPLKLAAERALLHELQLANGEAVMDAVVARLDSTTAKALQDYHRRVLSKLAGASSAAEGDDAEDELADPFLRDAPGEKA